MNKIQAHPNNAYFIITEILARPLAATQNIQTTEGTETTEKINETELDLCKNSLSRSLQTPF